MILFNLYQGDSPNQDLLEEIHKFTLMGMNYGWGTHISESGELIVLEILKDLYKHRTFTVFDVGANVGEYSAEVLKVFGNSVNVYAFEPSSLTFKELKANLEGTGVKVYNFGLSDRNETRGLYVNGIGFGGTVYQRRLDHLGVKLSKLEDINLRSLDDFCKENNVERINLLKMDIEGHELAALGGAKKLIKSGSIDLIQFEFGGCNIDSHTFFQDFYYLLNPHYKLFRMLKSGLVEMSSYKETQEIFITTNYLAISRDLEISAEFNSFIY
jgi:FkbM family methyltransferase